MDYIKLYLKKLKEESKNAIKLVEITLITNKSQFFSFEKTYNDIINKFIEIKKSNIVTQDTYKDLLHQFHTRTAIFEEEHQFEVIPRILEPEFKKITNNQQKSNFKNFVLNLSKYRAYEKVMIDFRNLRDIYSFMYKINKFEGFKHMPKFDIIANHIQTQNTLIFKELHALAYPILTSDKVIHNIEKQNDEDVKVNYFGCKKEFVDTFKSKESYLMLTDVIIDDEKTSFDDFINVFFKDPLSHDSEVHFLCETKFCSYLLLLFKNNFFKKLTFTNIEKSKKFHSKNKRPLKQSNISKSYKKASYSEQSYLERLIVNLKKNVKVSS
tara:strand:- start:7435 stop:8409 length:975 start_codon:yes stop_codon:yes gene_type:complete